MNTTIYYYKRVVVNALQWNESLFFPTLSARQYYVYVLSKYFWMEKKSLLKYNYLWPADANSVLLSCYIIHRLVLYHDQGRTYIHSSILVSMLHKIGSSHKNRTIYLFFNPCTKSMIRHGLRIIYKGPLYGFPHHLQCDLWTVLVTQVNLNSGSNV